MVASAGFTRLFLFFSPPPPGPGEDRFENPLAWHMVGKNLVAMAIQGAVMLALTILIQYKFFCKPRYLPPIPPNAVKSHVSMETAANVSPSRQARHGGAAVRRRRGRGRRPGTPASAGGRGPG